MKLHYRRIPLKYILVVVIFTIIYVYLKNFCYTCTKINIYWWNEVIFRLKIILRNLKFK